MEGSSGQYFRPDLREWLVCNLLRRVRFGRYNNCTVSHPLDDSPMPDCVIGNLTPLGWTIVYKSRNYLGFPPLGEQSLAWEELMVNHLMDDMAHVEKKFAPRGMEFVPAEIIIHTLADDIMRALLMLQTPRSTSRPHCLCCGHPPMPIPRVCDLSFKSVVWLIGDGVPNVDVSILPPMREFDPPAYVTLLFNPCGS
jgi:hypothetical protein